MSGEVTEFEKIVFNSFCAILEQFKINGVFTWKLGLERTLLLKKQYIFGGEIRF